MEEVKIHRQIFFDVIVHNQNVKNTLSSPLEAKLVEVCSASGFVQDKDFYHQYPVIERYVCDIAFPEELINFELDGPHHKEKQQSRKDEERDNFLNNAGWDIIRIQNEMLLSDPRFYKYLIYEVVVDKRKRLGLEIPEEW